MPGETLDDAVAAAKALRERGLTAILTYLGENVSDPVEARAVAEHYLEVVARSRAVVPDAEISVKLTQLGLDLGTELACDNLRRIAAQAGATGTRVYVDMEGTPYTDRTLEAFRHLRPTHKTLGICLQSYLHRTPSDLDSLVPLGPAIRLVKGAYREPPDLAFPSKHDVDEAFFALATRCLGAEARRAGVFLTVATHDSRLIRRISAWAEAAGLPKTAYQIAMLYGIRTEEQERLARDGYRVRVLISYGDSWFPWYMRRLAERPANLLFVLRNMMPG